MDAPRRLPSTRGLFPADVPDDRLARQVDEEPPARQQCPTCGAVRRGDATCHRCKSDLGALLDVEHRADGLRRQARSCYAHGWYRRAAELAAAVLSLEATPADRRFLTCACLMSGDYPRAWREGLRAVADERLS